MERYFDGIAGCLELKDCGETVWYCCDLGFRIGFMLMSIVWN